MLPARAGEFARVAVLRRHLPHGRGTSATLLGTVFAHRLFDLFPVAILVTWVLMTAKIPHWAVTSLIIFGLVGFVLLMIGVLLRPLRRRPRARRHGKPARARDHGPPGPRRPAAAGAGARRGDVPAASAG